ncbi:MAG: hypothetical protein Q4B42_02165 [Oscillospiraceae bacterium]|nr:hypothetical protein [Oscillospiraceae bacterium]
MRQLYEQTAPDATKKRFYARCPICGKRRGAFEPSLLLESAAGLKALESGLAGGVRQAAYDKSRLKAASRLARFFNRCRRCGLWVCDDCFDIESGGCCLKCRATQALNPKNENDN